MLISLDLGGGGGGGANCARAVFATGLTLSLSGYQPPSPPGGGLPSHMILAVSFRGVN